MSARLKHFTSVGDIAASALALGAITTDQEFQVSEALWMGRYTATELEVLDCLLDALVDGSVQRLDICLAA